MSIRTFRVARMGCVVAALACGGAAAVRASEESAGYSDFARLSERLRALEAEAPETARLSELARSVEGRAVWALELAAPGERAPSERTAILIVAGLDATHLVGTETAVGIAEALLSAKNGQPTTATAPAEKTEAAAEAGLLTSHTIYVVPRVNPDGAERFLGAVREENDANAVPTDDDRDGVPDDDPPEDLNGDGMITRMRVRDPEATHLPDPREPRLLRKADRAKGERPVFKIYTEGLDNDGDGEYNEDGAGGTILNRNFPHAYPELGAGAGRYQLSEPETLGLARFVLAHPNIAAVVVFGRHDNLVKVPGDKARDVSGRGYRDLHPDDTPIYKHLSERFRELTGLTGAPKSKTAGAFCGWVYNQRGLPTVATTVWWLPEEKKAEAKEGKEAPATQPATRPAEEGARAAASQPAATQAVKTAATQPAASTQAAATRPADSAAARRGTGKPGANKKPGPEKDPLKMERAWLKYSDEKRGGAGFVPWAPYEHPTLGRVEIGGFVPGFRINPPVEEVAALVEKQVAFVKDLAGRLPRPRVAACTVTQRSESIFELELSMTNDAYLPTAMGMAKTARVADPFVLRLDLPSEDVLGGRRVRKIASLAGMGATEKVRWLVRGQAGSSVTIHIHHRRFGTTDYRVRLEATGEGVKP